MASRGVERKMWQIILLSICLASLEFSVAEDLPYKQEVTGQLKYSPSLTAPLLYPPPSPNYPTANSQVPLLHAHNRQFGESHTPQDNCPQLDTLESILFLLKRLLNQADNAYVLQPEKRLQILQSLKEYLERSSSNVDGLDDNLNFKDILNLSSNEELDERDSLQHSLNKDNPKNHVEAQLTFKYHIPGINNVGCKEALATLLQTVKSAHLQMINDCKQSGNCNLSSEPGLSSSQDSDKSNGLLNLDKLIPTYSKITPSNPNLLNTYDIQNSIDKLVTSKNQLQTQKASNDYLASHKQQDSLFTNDQFLITNSLNPSVVQTQNNHEKYIDAYNKIYSNEKSGLSYTQDKHKFLNNIHSFNHPLPTQVKLSPPNRYPLTVFDFQSLPLSNQNQGLTPMKSNGYLNLPAQPESYLHSNHFLTRNTLNSGVFQNKNLIKQDNIQKNNLNIYDSNGNILHDIKRFSDRPTNAIKNFQGINNHLMLTNPSQNVEKGVPTNYKKDPSDQQLPYIEMLKLYKIINDNSASLAMIDQNKRDINERAQYEGISDPRHEFNILNYPSVDSIQPNEIKTFAPENLIASNLEMNLLENQNNQIVNPIFHSSSNQQQDPYLSSINLNRDSLNYNSQQADAAYQTNFGFNLYAPGRLTDYPNHDIYGNTLLNLHRAAGMSNVAKLNTKPDNDEVVELTYKLKRPQSQIYNPYYYIKYRMPYKDFVSKMASLSRNPHLRANPIKFHEELLSLSKLAEASPDLKNVQRDEVSKLILNNGGSLINAKILGATDSNTDQYLKIIQNLNANLNTNDFLDFVDNDKTYNPPLDSDIPIYTPEQNLYDSNLSYQNADGHYILDIEPRRLFVSMPFNDKKTRSITFLPARITSHNMLAKPETRPVLQTHN